MPDTTTLAPTSIAQLDLSPLPDRSPYNIDRQWNAEFIYFLMVDRFHDGGKHPPRLQSERSQGFPTESKFYGGTLRGVRDNLAYIAGLGCTTIWLSPVFECNGDAYHGYDINNYLAIDPRFGTKEDLVELVRAAHEFQLEGEPFPIRVVLDVVINHSGDNWAYPNDEPYFYSNDQQFDFGFWRREDRPIPTELRAPELYHRRGQLQESDWDDDPAKLNGDLFSLKDFANDDDETGRRVLDILIQAHCYWIREADVDGFRLDAVKHMGAAACSRFCAGIHEYATSLGKRDFFIFGELATPCDEAIDHYIDSSPQLHEKFGIDSLLDFRLSKNVDGKNPLRQVLRGEIGPQWLIDRLVAEDRHAHNRGEIGQDLATFLDNHDDFWQEDQARFGAKASDAQIVGGVGYLLCAFGTPCLYYGTEQGFSGGGSDLGLREAMFDRAPNGISVLNPQCSIYQGIAKIAHAVRELTPIHVGEMAFRQTSENGTDFAFSTGNTYTLAFSRLHAGNEVLVTYNVTGAPRNDAIIVDAELNAAGDVLCDVLSGTTVEVETAPDGARFVRVPLEANQFAIFRKS